MQVKLPACPSLGTAGRDTGWRALLTHLRNKASAVDASTRPRAERGCVGCRVGLEHNSMLFQAPGSACPTAAGAESASPHGVLAGTRHDAEESKLSTAASASFEGSGHTRAFPALGQGVSILEGASAPGIAP